MKSYDYIPRKGTVTARKGLAADTLGLKIKLGGREKFSFHPGQFVMLSVLGFGEVPLGITSDSSQKEIEVGVRSAGMVTQKICSLAVGDTVWVNGPFGNGFPLSRIKGRDVVIVAAGIGVLPLRSLIKHIERNKKYVKSLTIFIGSRCPENLIYKDEYKTWEKFAHIETTVDTCGPNWDGCVGSITKLFDRSKINRGSIMIVCGPPVIYKPIVSRFAGKSIADGDLYFMLERKMKCGVGKCQHCTCGKLYVCQDGPVFAYDEIKYNSEALK